MNNLFLYYRFTICVLVYAICFSSVQTALFLIQNQHPQPPKTICMAAGRSGGHIIPAKTILKTIKTQTPEVTAYFFSTDTELDHKLLQNNPTIDHHIAIQLENIPRNNIGALLKYGVQLLKLVRTYTTFFQTHKKALLISTGGYICIPLGFAAWCTNTPLILYELNTTPGQAVAVMGIFAKKIYCPFKKTLNSFSTLYAAEQAPYPIRFTKNQIHETKTARTYLHCKQDLYTIAILGGSQGSHFFNTTLPSYLASIAQKMHIQIIHQTGAQDEEAVRAYYQMHNIPALVFSFRNDIEYIYSAADVCIIRAGAGSIFEVLFFSKPSIIIPLTTGTTDHQLDNGRAITQEYPTLCVLLEQEQLHNDDVLYQQIVRLKGVAPSTDGHKNV